MNLRHGFKSEAEYYARELRRDLKLSPKAPLCPWKLAFHLEITAHPLSKFRSLLEKEIAYLLTKGAATFSAVTMFGGLHGTVRTIIYNDGNAKTRQAADLSHELSHAILGHPPTSLFDDDPVHDAEAKWMGPCLLVPKEAALDILKRNLQIDVAAEEYGVSSALMKMRLQASGAMTILKRMNKR